MKVKIQNEDGTFKRSYRKWSSMHRRCVDVNYQGFARYGGRGIYVCERWSGKDGYANFVADMGGEPPEGMTLGRKRGNDPYGPDNCQWETWKEQAKNREGAGAPKDPNSIRGKARAAGLPYMVVYHRLRAGWTLEKALSTPKAKRGPSVEPYFWERQPDGSYVKKETPNPENAGGGAF